MEAEITVDKGGSATKAIEEAKVQAFLEEVKKVEDVKATTSTSTSTLQIANCFNPTEEREDGWWDEIQDDMKLECGKFGPVLSVVVDNNDERGIVRVSFGTVAAAEGAGKIFDGRWFDKRQLKVIFVEDEKGGDTTPLFVPPQPRKNIVYDKKSLIGLSHLDVCNERPKDLDDMYVYEPRGGGEEEHGDSNGICYAWSATGNCIFGANCMVLHSDSGAPATFDR